MSADKEPTLEQLDAMAYVDGELDPERVPAFERRLAEDPHLAREVSQLRGVELLARRAAPAEPADFEWARHRKRPLHRMAITLGAALLSVGLLGAVIDAVLASFGRRVVVLEGISFTMLIVGLIFILVAAVHWRIAEYPYDPYVKVER